MSLRVYQDSANDYRLEFDVRLDCERFIIENDGKPMELYVPFMVGKDMFQAIYLLGMLGYHHVLERPTYACYGDNGQRFISNVDNLEYGDFARRYDEIREVCSDSNVFENEKFANVRDAYGNIYLLCHGFNKQEIDFLKQAMDEIDKRMKQ